jgi:hypothetical protein
MATSGPRAIVCSTGTSRHATVELERLSLFRFVRHLPVRRHGAAHASGLRAGVGQSSGEETAGHATVARSRYGATALWR